MGRGYKSQESMEEKEDMRNYVDMEISVTKKGVPCNHYLRCRFVLSGMFNSAVYAFCIFVFVTAFSGNSSENPSSISNRTNTDPEECPSVTEYLEEIMLEWIIDRNSTNGTIAIDDIDFFMGLEVNVNDRCLPWNQAMQYYAAFEEASSFQDAFQNVIVELEDLVENLDCYAFTICFPFEFLTGFEVASFVFIALAIVLPFFYSSKEERCVFETCIVLPCSSKEERCVFETCTENRRSTCEDVEAQHWEDKVSEDDQERTEEPKRSLWWWMSSPLLQICFPVIFVAVQFLLKQIFHEQNTAYSPSSLNCSTITELIPEPEPADTFRVLGFCLPWEQIKDVYDTSSEANAFVKNIRSLQKLANYTEATEETLKRCSDTFPSFRLHFFAPVLFSSISVAIVVSIPVFTCCSLNWHRRTPYEDFTVVWKSLCHSSPNGGSKGDTSPESKLSRLLACLLLALSVLLWIAGGIVIILFWIIDKVVSFLMWLKSACVCNDERPSAPQQPTSATKSPRDSPSIPCCMHVLLSVLVWIGGGIVTILFWIIDKVVIFFMWLKSACVCNDERPSAPQQPTSATNAPSPNPSRPRPTRWSTRSSSSSSSEASEPPSPEPSPPPSPKPPVEPEQQSQHEESEEESEEDPEQPAVNKDEPELDDTEEESVGESSWPPEPQQKKKIDLHESRDPVSGKSYPILRSPVPPTYLEKKESVVQKREPRKSIVERVFAWLSKRKDAAHEEKKEDMKRERELRQIKEQKERLKFGMSRRNKNLEL